MRTALISTLLFSAPLTLGCSAAPEEPTPSDVQGTAEDLKLPPLPIDYHAGDGLQLNTQTRTFSVDAPRIEQLAEGVCIDSTAELGDNLKTLGGGAACQDGSVLEWDEATNSWVCAENGGFSGDYADLSNAPDLSGYATSASLSPVATSGAYADLTGAPDLSGYATTASLASVASTGAYGDLSGTPDLSVYAPAASYSAVAFSGEYGDLLQTPDLSVYATTASLAAVATSGAYADLTGAPNLANYAETSSLAAVATSGAYADLMGTPDLSGFVSSAELAWVNEDTYAYAAVAAPPAPLVDQFNQEDGSPLIVPGNTLWQSFTPSRDGALVEASLEMLAAQPNVTFQVRSGAGLSGGPVLFSATVNVMVGTNVFPISNVNVTAETPYTIVLLGLPTPLLFKVSTSDPYPGGTAGWNSGSLAPFDLVFSTSVHAPSVVVTAEGEIGLGTSTPTAAIDVAHGPIRLRQSKTPASNSPCQQGEMTWGPSHLYVCIATNTWRRSALMPY
jgi:hypothetical protein